MEKQKKTTTKKKTVAKAVKEEKVLANKKEKKETKAKKEKKVGLFKAIINFFKSVKVEMNKVTWPTKTNMIKYSIAAIIFILFFALYFYGIEVVMAWLKSIIVII